ncbi:MAG: tetratricopeptide repeat protein, partial [Candidatus Heimdallarchaeaceae archaeon]
KQADLKKALNCCKLAEEIYIKQQETDNIVHAVTVKASILVQLGNFSSAEETVTLIYSIFNKNKNDICKHYLQETAKLTKLIADRLLDNNEHIKAKKHYNNALFLYQFLNDIQNCEEVYNKLALLHRDLKEYFLEVEKLEKLIEIYKMQKQEKNSIYVNYLFALGIAAYHNHDYYKAIETLKEVAEIFRKTQNRRGCCETKIIMGNCFHETNLYLKAQEQYKQSIEILEEMEEKDRELLKHAYCSYGNLLLKLNKKESLLLFNRVLKDFIDLSIPELETENNKIDKQKLDQLDNNFKSFLSDILLPFDTKMNLFNNYMQNEKIFEAGILEKKLLDEAKKSSQRSMASTYAYHLALVYIEFSDFVTAKNLIIESLSFIVETEFERARPFFQLTLAKVCATLGEFERVENLLKILRVSEFRNALMPEIKQIEMLLESKQHQPSSNPSEDSTKKLDNGMNIQEIARKSYSYLMSENFILAEKFFKKMLYLAKQNYLLDEHIEALANLAYIYIKTGKEEASKEMFNGLQSYLPLYILEGKYNQNLLMTLDKLVRFLIAIERYIEAIMIGEKTLIIESKLENIEGIGCDFSNLGLSYYALSYLEKAELMYRKALGVFQIGNIQSRISNQLLNLGKVLGNKWENEKVDTIEKSEDYSLLEEANILLKKALKLAEEQNDHYCVIMTNFAIGRNEILKGNLNVADEIMSKVIDDIEKQGRLFDEIKKAGMYIDFGILKRRIKDYESSDRIYAKAYNIFSRYNLNRRMALLCYNWGNMLEEAKRYREAQLKWNKSLDLSLQIGDAPRVASLYDKLGDSFVKTNDYIKAFDCYFRCIAVLIYSPEREWLEEVKTKLKKVKSKLRYYL